MEMTIYSSKLYIVIIKVLQILSEAESYIVDIQRQAFRADISFAASGTHHDYNVRGRSIGRVPALLYDRHHLAFGIAGIV